MRTLLPLLLLTTAPRLPAQDAPFPRELVQFRSVYRVPLMSGWGDGSWNSKIRERGWIMRENEKYRMWFTGYDGTREGIKLLGYATSPDGVNWYSQREPLLRDLWVEDMMVIRHADRYLMFAEGRNDQAQMLSSPDGLRWKKECDLDVRLKDGTPVPPGPLGTPTVFVKDDVFHLFYERRDAGVWLATSKDLRVWKNVSDDPILRPGPGKYDGLMIAMNQVIKRGDWYYAYYHGTGSPEKPRAWCTCIAASRDLVHWTKYKKNPLLPVEENKSSGIVVSHGNRLRLYTMHDRVELHETPAKPKDQQPR